ncbi:Translation initiation factor 3 subunit b [Podila clonocystis]|nr:Translation initiation factor 3 subunit b [Podila clonocystis]
MTNNMTYQNALHQEAAGHQHCCSIIPPYILQDIADSNNVSEAVRAIATKSLANIATIHNVRISAQGHVSGPSAALSTSFAAAPTPKPLFRRIYINQGFNNLPGILVFAEDGIVAPNVIPRDKSARKVYENFQKIFDFYRTVFKRNSYDGAGAKLDITVHFDNNLIPGYNNAFWYPNWPLSQWAFGDGDFLLFDNFTKLLDISGHEFTHAVVEHTGILPYWYQAGALNESIADVFGSMIKQYFAPGGPQKAEDADWLVGKGLWLAPGGRALRDMENPGTAFDIIITDRVTKDRQPAHMGRYADLEEGDDAGGVHINSGIPNRAFVLVAKTLGGFSWEVAGKIWYSALKNPRLREHFTRNGEIIQVASEYRSMDTFKIFANLTIKHARAHSPNAENAVKNAWKDVGVLP